MRFGIQFGTKPRTRTFCTSWHKQKWKPENFSRPSNGRIGCWNIYRNRSFCPLPDLPLVFVRCYFTRPSQLYLIPFPANFPFAVGHSAAITWLSIFSCGEEEIRIPTGLPPILIKFVLLNDFADGCYKFNFNFSRDAHFTIPFHSQLTMSYETQRCITSSHGKVSLQHQIIHAHFWFCNFNVADFITFFLRSYNKIPETRVLLHIHVHVGSACPSVLQVNFNSLP